MNLNLHSLTDAVAIIKQYCADHHINMEACNNINLVCEELIVNLLNYTQSKSFNLSLKPAQQSTEIVISYQGKAFDPTILQKPEQKSLEDMQYGGLGLVLVNSLASKTEYHYDKKQSENVIKIII